MAVSKRLTVAAAGVLIALGTGVALPKAAIAQSTASAVDPAATAAAQRMRDYLRSLQSFEVRAQATAEEPLDSGGKVQVSNRVRYEYRAPDRLFAEWQSDRELRRLYFDGQTVSLVAPVVGFYTTVERKGSAAEMLQHISEQYGVVFPLPDLFLWAWSTAPAENVTAATYVGYASVEGRPADQFMFTQGDVDWQVWIARGDQPLPLKLVITDRSDPTMPSYSAVLKWNVNPTFSDDRFVFTPPSDQTKIEIVALTGDR
ncbi:MAG: DUF2092 domain-containing protein [Porphyrobacter sp.]|nr:DUF2092 domain-containing protein [Porphyrobacter sp.]